MFRYSLGQTIYYLIDNKIHSAEVLSRSFVDNLHEDWNSTKTQCSTFKAFGDTGVFYSTCHGIVNEKLAFPTKEELTKSLLD